MAPVIRDFTSLDWHRSGNPLNLDFSIADARFFNFNLGHSTLTGVLIGFLVSTTDRGVRSTVGVLMVGAEGKG